MSLTYTPSDELGWALPSFELGTVDGRRVTPETFKDQFLVVSFICNHCPYVKAIEERLISSALEIQKMGGAWLAICSNDPTEYPEDNIDALRSRAAELKYPFLYAVDHDQTFAKKMGAVCTPDFFIFDSKHLLRYRGRLDDSWRDAKKVRKFELLDAARALSRGDSVTLEMRPSMGCSIKWTE